MVLHNQEDSTESAIKNLSEDEALYEYDRLFAAEASNIMNAYNNLGRLLSLLEQAGYSRSEAINKMAKDASEAGLKGFSQRSIYRMLPEEIKGPTKPQPRNKLPNGNLAKPKTSAATLVVDEEPKIPAMRHTIIEPIELPPPPQEPLKRKHEEAWIPYPLAEQLSKFLLSRLIGISKGKGDPGVGIKINDQGEVYLP